MDESSKIKYLLLKISMKEIRKIEHAIYNPKRLYIWYVRGSNRTKRIDIEFKSQSASTNILNRIKYSIKNSKSDQYE